MVDPFTPDKNGRVWDYVGNELDPVTRNEIIRFTDVILQQQGRSARGSDDDSQAHVAGVLHSLIEFICIYDGDMYEPPSYEPEYIGEIRVPARYRCWGKGGRTG